ncbi:MAG: hypothetical protein K2G60_04635 [Oscillospiraceae bacterium]|nr:hypothetical protein [Oscillospiraceae bacterium]
MCNTDIRAAAKESGVFLYAIADKLGISEPTMMRLMRHELPAEKKMQIKKIIAEIAAERHKSSDTQ